MGAGGSQHRRRDRRQDAHAAHPRQRRRLVRPRGGHRCGTRYRYRIDDRWGYPDPYSRSQPDGPHGPSEVIHAADYSWHDDGWRGLTAQGLAIYELHAGTYTPEGTFDALIGQLDAIAELGVTAIELMPIAEFPGARNWGYDGVDLFAPSHVYGGPAALKRLVDAAHQRGLGIILDAVYNHLGPDGNYLPQFARDYFTSRHKTRWGDAINYDGPNSAMVRRFFIDNACYWLNEFHIDGLRIDAAFTIFDESERHILEELATSARQRPAASPDRHDRRDVRERHALRAAGRDRRLQIRRGLGRRLPSRGPRHGRPRP